MLVDLRLVANGMKCVAKTENGNEGKIIDGIQIPDQNLILVEKIEISLYADDKQVHTIISYISYTISSVVLYLVALTNPLVVVPHTRTIKKLTSYSIPITYSIKIDSSYSVVVIVHRKRSHFICTFFVGYYFYSKNVSKLLEFNYFKSLSTLPRSRQGSPWENFCNFNSLRKFIFSWIIRIRILGPNLPPTSYLY